MILHVFFFIPYAEKTRRENRPREHEKKTRFPKNDKKKTEGKKEARNVVIHVRDSIII